MPLEVKVCRCKSDTDVGKSGKHPDDGAKQAGYSPWRVFKESGGGQEKKE